MKSGNSKNFFDLTKKQRLEVIEKAVKGSNKKQMDTFIKAIPPLNNELKYCPYCGKKLPEVESKPVHIPSCWTGDPPNEGATTTYANTDTKYI